MCLKGLLMNETFKMFTVSRGIFGVELEKKAASFGRKMSDLGCWFARVLGIGDEKE